jgi:predicted O-linked N-acetylglucosamine transferase (SPINDLY family)
VPQRVELKSTKFAQVADPQRTKLQAAFDAQDWLELVRLCKQVLRKQPRHQQAHRWLGFALGKLRNTDDAFVAYKKAIAYWPDDAELLINYAHLLVDHARNAEALPLQEKVCSLKPDLAVSWLELAGCCYLLNLHEKGLGAAQIASQLATQPSEQAMAYMQKAIHRRELGQVKEAVQDCEAAIAINPQDPGNHTNRLLFMLADPQTDAQQLAAAAREFATVFETPLKPFWPNFAEHQGNPWRKLKVGFLSPDFRAHAVMYSVEGLLAQLDRRQFDVFAFYLYQSDDHITMRVQRHADHFIRLGGFSADEQAQMIREQQIDILIDLAGHTGNNALLAMARKAAPVQISWLGFPASTGLQAIDYKFTDEVTDPEDADSLYSERLFRLPTLFACYRPLSRDPLWRYQPRYLVRPTPALTNGFVTFGSCNNLGKLTDDVLRLWGRVLQAVPEARLLIEGKNLDKPEFSSTYRQRCKALGIDDTRLELVPLDTGQQYLTYHRIDIALDPFPLTGGTTTFDVLWMGVPLVSLKGDNFKSRIGTGILTYLGRTEWLADSADQYVTIAQKLAADVAQLNATRMGLRAEVENSPVMREDLFCDHFSQGLRAMWLQWLAQQAQPNDIAAQEQMMQSWLPDIPSEWATPPVPGVGLRPGHRVPLHEAHQCLEQALAKAKGVLEKAHTANGQIENKRWAELTELAETVLCAVPHDPVALACLAEVEFAHGHTDFAMTYLRYATESMSK